MLLLGLIYIVLSLNLASVVVFGLKGTHNRNKVGRAHLCTQIRATGGNPGMQGGEEKPMMGIEGGIVGSNKDSGDIPEEIRIENLPKMSRGLQAALRKTVGELISSKAVDTTSHYMKEFRNDADLRWMTNYKGYNANSFSAVFPGRSDSGWTDWFESMIKTDKLEIQILMSAPKTHVLGKSRVLRKSPDESAGENNEAVGDLESTYDVSDSGLRIEYMHDLEPRKIANQLLVVRESISKEVLLDLPCIRLECIEAVRYAKVKVEKGEEEAIKTMKMTRSATAGSDSTPLRDRTYHDIAVIATNFALQMVYDSSDDSTKAYLDAFVAELDRQESERTLAERLLHEHVAPIEMLEELHYRGLNQGLTSIEDQALEARKVNILRISQTLLDCRYAVSLEIKKIVSEDDSLTRQYYKLIKDNGGFKKFDLEGKGKIRLVNLNAEPGDELYPSASKSSASLDMSEFGSGEVEVNNDAEISLEKLNLDAEGEESKPRVIAVINDVTEDSEGDSFGGGPFLM